MPARKFMVLKVNTLILKLVDSIYMTQRYVFPKDFLWGTATSAHQIEGGNKNDWTEWEKSEKRIKELKSQGKNPQDFISGQACDHYNRYEEDFDLIKKLNNNAHRFSIEWSRIEPKKGQFNEKEIEHYRKVLLALKKRNIKSMATLWHWPLPLWLAEIGGWSNGQIINYFERYTKIIAKELGDLIDFWITLNEPVLWASYSHFSGIWPPQKRNLLAMLRVLGNLIKAHKKAYKAIHKINQEAKVGIANNMGYFEPFNSKSILDKFNARFFHYFANEFFLNRIKKHQDFIGVNYYQRNGVKFPFLIKERNKEISDLGWEIHPKGIYYLLKDLKKYQKPIYITENGIADVRDAKRAKFIIEHLKWIHRAIQEGIDARGYFYWSLIDNFEWAYGFAPKFGLIEIDYEAMERKPRPSAYVYAKICKANAIVTNKHKFTTNISNRE